MKKKLLFSWVFFIFSALFAEGYSMPNQPMSNQNQCCAPMQSCCSRALSPCCDNLDYLWCPGLEIIGEALLLTASNKATDYGVTATNEPTGARPDPINGDLLCIRPGYEWGFRVKAIGTLPRDAWRISGSFVGWEAKERRVTNFSFIYPTFANPGPNVAEALDAVAVLDNELYFFDIGLSRIVPLTCSLAIEPGISVRFLKFEQTLKVTYDNLSGGIANEDAVFIDIEQEFRAIGPRFGFDLFWHIWSGLFLTGKLGIVPLYGETKLSSGEVALLNTGDFDDVLSAKGKSWYGESMIETGIGLLWRSYFTCVPMGMEITFSWEQWQTSSFGDILFFNNAPTPGSFALKRGDICFQGITFGAGLQF